MRSTMDYYQANMSDGARRSDVEVIIKLNIFSSTVGNEAQAIRPIIILSS